MLLIKNNYGDDYATSEEESATAIKQEQSVTETIVVLTPETILKRIIV